MRILVTGSRGLIGTRLVSELRAEGHEVVGIDRRDGFDVREPDSVRSAVRGCEAIVHLAALIGGPGETAPDILSVNLLGMWHVLCAAEDEGVQRVVFYSSVNATGLFMGDGEPDYLPLDDDHPCRPKSPYGVSKRLAEEMCRHFTDRTGIATICLRLPAVFDKEAYERIRSAREDDPEFEWTPFWEYGAFLDVRDAAMAGIDALDCVDPGHVTLLLCADDVSSREKTSVELVRAILPSVEWRGGDEYERDPYRALLDTRRAKSILGWSPRHRWRSPTS